MDLTCENLFFYHSIPRHTANTQDKTKILEIKKEENLDCELPGPSDWFEKHKEETLEIKKEENLDCVLPQPTDWFEKHKEGVSEDLGKNPGKKILPCQRNAWCRSELHPLATFLLLQEGESEAVYCFSQETLEIRREENLDYELSWNTGWVEKHKEGSETSSSRRSNGVNQPRTQRKDDSPGQYFLTDSQLSISLDNEDTEELTTQQLQQKPLKKETTEAEKNDYDNLPEKAQSDDGTNSLESIDHAIDGKSATGTFGALGGKLSTKSHGFTLHIPPGALDKNKKISLQVLTEIPNGLSLKEDELLVSHGFQCYPSGLRFKKPAKLIIPHCALVTAPNKVHTILYSWNQSGTPKRLPDSPDFICLVQKRWLEVSVSHFSGGFITLIRDWLFLKGILLSCMSFLPRLLPPSRKPVLEVRFVKKPHDQEWNDVHALNDTDFQPVKGDDDDIVFGKGTLKVACQLSEKSWVRRDPIQYSEMSSKRKVTRYFPLDLTEESDETLVTLEVVQTSTQTIQFNTRFQDRQRDDYGTERSFTTHQ